MNLHAGHTEVRDGLREVLGSALRESIPGASVTTYAIGGPIEFLCEAQSIEQLSHLVAFCTRNQLPTRFLGAGSNVLIADDGLSGVVVRLGRSFRTVTPLGEARFAVGGAMSLMSLSRELSDSGFSGLEFAGGIPASFAGAVRMNAGAHGGEIGSLLESVSILLPDGRSEVLGVQDLRFSYRHSEFPLGSCIVSATLRLAPGDKVRTATLRREHLAERKRRQPLTVPSAGSVFKNPSSEKSAGFLIEAAGLKGTEIGGATISNLHANWIVNEQRNAKASDVRDLIALCRERVLNNFNVNLEPELQIW